MPSGPRVRTDNVFGTTTDNPLTNVATTLNSAGLTNLAAVSSAHAVIILDPLRASGAPEVVIVTAHTASASSATVTRGAYGTSARQHASGTLWVHAPTREDFIQILTAATRPSDPFEGQLIYETDTDRYQTYTGSAWRMPHNPPACRARRTTTQSIADSSQTFVQFDASDLYDTDNMHDTVTNNTRITFNTAGLYEVGASVQLAAAADYAGGVYSLLRLNGTTDITGFVFPTWTAAGYSPLINLSTPYKFSAGDFLQVVVYHDNSANAARNLTVGNGAPEFWATWVGVG